MFDRRFQSACAWCVTALSVILFTAASAAAQGFQESATSAGLRPTISAGQSQTFLPQRGAFTFPAPYNTTGFRLTNGDDCGGQDCVSYVGYSYWNNINNHTGSDTMLVFLGLDRRKGGAGPTLFSVNKRSGETKNLGAMFPPDSNYSWNNGEGWYWSDTRPTTIYMNDGPRMLRYDVQSHNFETVFDVSSKYGSNRYIWQMHSSTDDRVHSATLRDSGSYDMLGCVAYREDTRQWWFIEKHGDFDECQIDKSGRYLVIKENVDGRNGEDNRIVDLQTGVERVLLDENGAAGHSDLGYGYMVAEDNFNSQPGAVRVWRFDHDVTGGQPAADAAQGKLVYQLASWNSGLGHVAHSNSKGGMALEQQVACVSNASRQNLPRVNEIVCFRLDGSLNALVVAPNLSDLNASGGGGEDYNKLPKGNLDVTGQYFIWTANAGSGRLDAYIVRVPVERLGLTPVTSAPPPPSQPAPAPAPTNPAPPPAPAPAPAPTTPSPSPTTVGQFVQWVNGVNVSANGGTLQKTSGCGGCADAGATSEQQLSSNDGGIQFTASDASTLKFIGLTSGSGSHNPNEIQFALRVQNGVAEVRESGSYRSEIRIASGDILGIYILGGSIHYAKNGTVFYSSPTNARYPLRVDTSLYDSGATINDAMIVSSASAAPGGVAAAPQAPAPTPGGRIAVRKPKRG